MSLSVNATLHEIAGPDMPGKVPSSSWGTLLLNLAGASASALFRSGAQFKNNAQGSRANENKGLDCAEYTCGMGSQDDGINVLLIRFTWNTHRRRRSSRLSQAG
jgi:hypothetical protein